MDSPAGARHSMALISHVSVIMLLTLLSLQHVTAQTCTCTGVDMSAPAMSGSGSDMGNMPTLDAAVENLTAMAGMDCGSLTVTWSLRGDSIMLSQLDYTITLTNVTTSEVVNTMNFAGNFCVPAMGSQCGEYLTRFSYTIEGLSPPNQSYNLSLLTNITNNSMYEIRTPEVTTMATTVIAAPVNVTISSELLGAENRTLAGVGQNVDGGGLNLFTEGFDIVVFSNTTVFNLSWTPVNDMDIIDDYVIMAELRNAQPPYNNSATVPVGSTLNISEIIPTANYTLCIRARNCAGTGPETCVTLIAPEGAPTAARNLTASPGRNNVTLMWLSPVQPNGNVSYTYSVSVTTSGASITSGTATTLSAIVENLRAFTNYTFTVTAMTSAGSSAPVMETFMTLEGLSEAVNNFTVITTARTALLTANLPNITSGVITYYEVSYRVTGSSDVMMLNFNTTTNDMPLNGTVTGLIPFTNYTFSVRACAAAGCGDPSDEVTQSTLEDAPSSPRNVTVTSLNATAVTVNWDEPAMPNGMIRNYTISVFTSDSSLVLSTSPVVVTSLRTMIFGLTHDTLYVFNVSAVTIAEGDPGSAMFRTRPLPSQPSNVTVETGGLLQALVVDWDVPQRPAGVIASYMVNYNGTTLTTGGNITILTITGLDPFTLYSITVTACTVDGCGNQTNPFLGTTAEEAPGRPQNVTASPIDSTTIQINWNVPTVTNGIIRYYTVVYRINSSMDLMELNSTSITALVTGLTPFTFYTLHVLAVTVARSEASENVTIRTNEAAPSAPLNVVAFNVSSTSINVMWHPPMTPNGIVRSYRVVYTTGSTTADVTTTNISIVITMLEIFTAYQVQVFATTVTEGNGSNSVMVTTDEDRPGPPGDLFVNEVNSTAIVVTWDQPGVTNGIITSYEILYSVGNVTTVSDNNTSVLVDATTNTSYERVIGGLDPFTVYTVVVRAYTRIGAGDLTDTFSILTDPDSSSPPVNFMVMVLNSTAVQLSWQYPMTPNGEIRGYSILDSTPPNIETVILNITLDTVDDTSNQTAIIAELTPFTYYGFRVRAYSFGDQNERPNFVHIGIATDEIRVRTDEDVPDAPRNFSAVTMSSTSVQLSWVVPNPTNGVLLNYTVVYSNSTNTLMMVYDNNTFMDEITDLNEDTDYDFVIYGNTSAGAGPNATDLARTFEDLPSAPPQNVRTMVLSSTSISVFWDPPPFLDQNGVITGYQVTVTNVNRTNVSTVVNVTNTSHIALDLQEFEAYDIEVAAMTAVGLGPFSDAVRNQTLEDIPATAPLNPSVTVVSSQSVRLSWDPPVLGDQNGILLRYHVIVMETQILYLDDETLNSPMGDNFNRTYDVSEGRMQLVDMLHPSYNYTVRIAAATAAGIGPFSDPITVMTLEDAPTETPLNVSITVETSRNIMLSWDRPSLEEQNGILTIYHVIIMETQILYLDNGTVITPMGENFNRTYNVSEGRIQLVDMLHPSYNYTVRIAAATAAGIGPFSDPITVMTLEDAPTETPLNVSVTVETSRNITLSWDRPSLEEQNGILTIYHVIIMETQTLYLDNGTVITPMGRNFNRTYNVSEGRIQLVDMLHPSYNYTVRIAAATAAGIGPFSDPITVMTLEDAPAETPLNVNVTVETSRNITLSWDRPSLEEQNGILTIYHVIIMETQILYLDDGTVITPMGENFNRTYNVSEGRIQLVDMLHPSYNYTVRIAAATSAGIGPFSDPITVMTLEDAPTETPLNVSVTVETSRNITLSWDRPSLEQQNGILTIYHVIIMETQILFLDNGTVITPMGENFNRTYNVSEGRIQLVNMLHPSYNYTVRIAAATAAGIGSFSDPITVMTLEDAPTETPLNVSVTVETSRNITLSWDRPSLEEQNGILTIYHVIIMETQILYLDNGTVITPMGENFNRTYNVSEGRIQLVAMLHPSYNYTVRIAAATAAGIGPFSEPITVMTLEDAPIETPLNVNVTVETSRNITLSWDRPSLEEQNGILTIYHVIIMETQILYLDNGTVITPMGRNFNRTYEVLEGRKQLVDMLHPSYNYTVRIAAATSAGIGPFSDPITVMTLEDAPTETPLNVSVTVETSRNITLSWDRPSLEEQNGILTIYHVIIMETQILYLDNGTVITPMGENFNRTYDVSEGRIQLVNMLHPSYNYTVRIAAATAAGIGPFSDPITVMTLEDAPTETPLNVSVTVETSRNITLSWDRPSLEEQNGILTIYHVIIMETQILYLDDGTVISPMGENFNRTYDVSEGRIQLVDMLHPSYNYTVRIAAATAAGIGPFSDPITVMTLEDAPTETPLNVSVTVETSRNITLSWDRPSLEQQNGILTIYHVIIMETQILYLDDGTVISPMGENFNRTYDVSEGRIQLVDMLHPSYNYTVRIAAATAAGIGPFSDPITVMTLEDAPTETPLNVSVTVETSRNITLSWDRPSLEQQNGILTIYHVIIMETQILYLDNGTVITPMGENFNRTYDVSEGRIQLVDMLHPSYNYTVRIAAATAAGIGPFSDPITVMTLEDAPTETPLNVNVTVETSRNITLSWDRPSLEQQNGILTIYHVIIMETQILYLDNGTVISPMGENFNRTYDVSEGRIQLVDMLHPSYNYTVRIAAATAAGIGPFSDPITVMTLEDAPTETPLNVSVTVETSRNITLSWDRPSLEEQNGILTIYHVIIMETQILYLDNGTVITPMGENFNRTYNVSEGRLQLVDMLHPSYNYTVRIAAATAAGIGPFSDPITVMTLEDAPTETPLNVSVTVETSRNITLSWDRPSLEEQNGILTMYHVIIMETQILYLDNGTVISPMGENFNRTYDVSEGRIQLVDMLHPSYNYTVRIAAATAAGIGPFSDPITVMTLEDAPTETPLNVNVTVVTSRNITLSWDRPSLEEQNGILTIYHVIIMETQVLYLDDGTVITPMGENFNRTYDVSEGRIQLVDMLHPHHNYTVRIAAATAAGIGPFSDPITVLTFEDAPTETPNVNVTVETSRNITLSWDRPSLEEHNGLIVIYHVIILETKILYLDNGTVVTQIGENFNRTYDDLEGRIQLVDMLHPSYNYTVRIAAATSAGIGPFSGPITVMTLEDAPTETPLNVSVTVETSRNITLSWDRPSLEEQNGILTIYHVIIMETQILYLDNGTVITPMGENFNRTYDVSEGRIQLVDMLHPSYNYTVRIAAATAAGIGPFSDPFIVMTLEDAPTETPLNVSVTVETSRNITLSWDRPSLEEQNGILTIYHVIIMETQILYLDNGTVITPMGENFNRTYDVSEGRIQLVDMLHPSYNYTVRIAAATAAGIGPFSDPITVMALEDVPTEVPLNVSVAVEGSRNITLSWDRPSLEEQNGILTIYHVIIMETQILYLDNGTVISPMGENFNRTYDVSEARIQLVDMLHPSYNYTVRIAAATEPGIGPFSDPITVMTLEDVPLDPPQNVTVEVVSSQSIYISWESPILTEQNGDIVSYDVRVVDLHENNETNRNVPDRNITIEGLRRYGNVSVTVAARTLIGTSENATSAPVEVRTFEDFPGPPENFTVIALNYTTVLLSWQPPILENGVILYYTITYNGSREELKDAGTGQKEIMYYNQLSTNRSADVLETTITHDRMMQTIVSNSDYTFQITAATVNGSGPSTRSSPMIVDIPIGTVPTPSEPPDINFIPTGVPIPTTYPSGDPTKHDSLSFILSLPPTDDGDLTDIFIIVQEVLEQQDTTTLRRIGTWYEAFTARIQRGDIPPAYIAIQYPASRINAERFKRDLGDRGRSARQEPSGNLVVTLGNGGRCEENVTVCNGPLKPNSNYSVAYNACTEGGCAVSPLSSPIETDDAPSDDGISIGIIIGVVVAVVVIVVVILIIVVICYCRKKSKKQQYSINTSGSTSTTKGKASKRGGNKSSSMLLPSSPSKNNGSFFESEAIGPTIVPVKDQPSSYTSDDLSSQQEHSRRIYLRDLPAHVADMSNDSGYKFSEEYERVSEVGLDQAKEASLMAENRAKNRYTNILAYDHSRTKLSFVDDDPGSDYINGNYIPGYKMKRAYVATQGPLPCTFDDFWRMVWEQNVHTIVMLTQLVERGRNKCHHYWPGMEPALHGEVSVVMQSEKESEEWTVREFILSLSNAKDKKERIVRHFQFTGWPDHGVPDNPGPVLEFVRAVRAQQDPSDSNGPMVVHCSAGVGRTGTFIALDTLLQHINDHDWVDIFSIACEMRQQRNHMIQTEAQYIFIHKSMLDVVESRSTFRYSVYGNNNRKSYGESEGKSSSPIMASTKM